MVLKETLDILAAFGYAAGALTAVKLACDALHIWGPSTIKEPFSPEIRTQMEEGKEALDSLRARTTAFLQQKRAFG